MNNSIKLVDLPKIFHTFEPDIDAVVKWCDELYVSLFSDLFEESHQMYKKLRSKSYPVSDEDLSYILIDLPVQLIQASEALSKLKISSEVIKMRTKQEELDYIQKSMAKTMTQKKEDAAIATLDAKLLGSAYQSVIVRVENEIAFSRELIMSAKKIWDSRRKTEEVNPVSPADGLPEYKAKTPIYGG